MPPGPNAVRVGWRASAKPKVATMRFNDRARPGAVSPDCPVFDRRYVRSVTFAFSWLSGLIGVRVAVEPGQFMTKASWSDRIGGVTVGASRAWRREVAAGWAGRGCRCRVMTGPAPSVPSAPSWPPVYRSVTDVGVVACPVGRRQGRRQPGLNHESEIMANPVRRRPLTGLTGPAA